MASLQSSVSQGCEAFFWVMCRVGMYVCAVSSMKLVRFFAAVEGSCERSCAQSVFVKVELSEVQSAFLKSYTCRVVAVSWGAGKWSVVRVALWSAIFGRTVVVVCEGKLVRTGSRR